MATAGTRVRVHNPGGALDVELGDAGIFLAGPTQKVGDVTVDEAVLAALVDGRRRASATGPRSAGSGARRVRDRGGDSTVTLIERSFRERIVLVGVVFPWTSADAVDADLDELALLVDTAGADVVGRVVQRRDRPDPATFVGRGKAEELHELSETLDADTVVFDDELSPAQQRNLEKILGRTAIDRTAVILDIFAQNARTQEGKAQVELALLRYRLPRLRGKGLALSQQAGGIGTRGPGETQLEVDRRRLVRRMTRLEADLKQVSATRRTQSRSRPALAPARRQPRRLHQRREVDPAQPADRRRRARRGPAVLDPRLPHPPPGPARRRDGAAVRHGRVRPQAAPPAGRGVPLHAGGGQGGRPARARGRRVGPRARDADRRGARRARRDRRRRACPSCWWSTRPTAPRVLRRAWPTPTRGPWWSRPSPARGSSSCCGAMGDRLRVADRVVELVVPFDRGDVLAAVHREGEVVDESHSEGATVVHVVLDDAGRARFREFVAS